MVSLGRMASAQHFLPAASAKELAPSCIGSSFPLDPASYTDRGTLSYGQPSVSLSSHPGRKLERALQRCRKTPAQHGTMQFTGSKLRKERQGSRPTGEGGGRGGGALAASLDGKL